jgi:ribose-phosphate pyrophosphokinase
VSNHVVFAGRGSPRLGASLAKALDCPIVNAEIHSFPDGELYVRIKDDVAGKHVVCIQTTMPNEHFVELLLMQDAAREAGAAKISTVVPYYAYARQDQKFHSGEAISARAIARALNSSADQLLIVDPHKEHILDFFDGETATVSAIPSLCDSLRAWGVDLILAPDKGARDRAEEAASVLGVPFDHLEKTRIDATTVEMKTKDLNVAGLTVAIVDDMIASGSTMVMAASQLKAQGAKQVIAACTHGIYTKGAVDRLLAAGIDHVLCTDSIEAAAGDNGDVVSCAPAIAAALQG